MGSMMSFKMAARMAAILDENSNLSEKLEKCKYCLLELLNRIHVNILLLSVAFYKLLHREKGEKIPFLIQKWLDHMLLRRLILLP